MSKQERGAMAPFLFGVKEMAEATEEKLSVSIRLKATGASGFHHTAEAEYSLSREQFETLQRAVLGALMGLQKTSA